MPLEQAAAAARAEARLALTAQQSTPSHDTSTPATETPTPVPFTPPQTRKPATLVGQLRPLLAIDDPIDGTGEPDISTQSTDADESGSLKWQRRVTSPQSVPRWPASATGTLVFAGLGVAARGAMNVARVFLGNSTESWASERLDSMQWPTRPLRVGVADPALRHALERTSGRCALEWIAVSPNRSPDELCRRKCLDAVLRMDPKGNLLLVMPDARPRAAAWHDWSSERPVTFATLFPGRVDCAELVLPSEATRPGATWFLRRLVEAASVFARHPSRLSALDRLNGRTPRIDLLQAVELPPTGDPSRDAQRLVVNALWDGLKEAQATHLPGCVPAARVVSAFIAGADDELPDSTRVDMALACANLAPDEPEVHLRLAAACFAAQLNDQGMDALLRGERLLRDRPMKAGTNQVPFLQAELEAGGGRSISLGRVAAGIALVCASLESSHLAYFRDDVLDDVSHSDWLIPKEQDRQLILDVFHAIMGQRVLFNEGRIAA